MNLSRPAAIALTVSLLPEMVGCTQPINDRLTIGGTYLPPTFAQHPEPKSSPDERPVLLFDHPTRSHDQWTPVQYLSPMDGVAHGHTFALSPLIKHTDPDRIYGRYPTPQSVLAYHPDTLGSWINEVFFWCDELGRSFIGTPYAIGYLTISGHLDEPILSPIQNWKRTNQIQEWSTGYPTPKEHTIPEETP